MPNLGRQVEKEYVEVQVRDQKMAEGQKVQATRTLSMQPEKLQTVSLTNLGRL
jgi:hypothetical protein